LRENKIQLPESNKTLFEVNTVKQPTPSSRENKIQLWGSGKVDCGREDLRQSMSKKKDFLEFTNDSDTKPLNMNNSNELNKDDQMANIEDRDTL
jgi:hypothetical protein